jgi:hypothetical protein
MTTPLPTASGSTGMFRPNGWASCRHRVSHTAGLSGSGRSASNGRNRESVGIGDRNHFRPAGWDVLPGHNIVAFYDATYANDERFPSPHGQFVSSYYAETLLETNAHLGLDLYGSEPLWKIDGWAMQVVRDWVRLMIVRMP